MKCQKNVFTLIELLVVISIIAILAGMLLPTLSKAREKGRAIASANNCKQWGTGNLMFADDHQERLAWDGEDTLEKSYASSNAANDSNELWQDVIPPYVSQPALKDFATNVSKAANAFHNNTIFCDPSARTPGAKEKFDATYDAANKLSLSAGYYYFFAYVPNSKLNSNSTYTPFGAERTKLTQIKRGSATVMFLEKRTTVAELTAQGLSNDTAGFYKKSVDRTRADWQRVAARHNKGAYIVFADGHVDNIAYRYMITAGIDAVSNVSGGYNKPDLIWNPLGTAN